MHWFNLLSDYISLFGLVASPATSEFICPHMEFTLFQTSWFNSKIGCCVLLCGLEITKTQIKHRRWQKKHSTAYSPRILKHRPPNQTDCKKNPQTCTKRLAVPAFEGLMSHFCHCIRWEAWEGEHEFVFDISKGPRFLEDGTPFRPTLKEKCLAAIGRTAQYPLKHCAELWKNS